MIGDIVTVTVGQLSPEAQGYKVSCELRLYRGDNCPRRRGAGRLHSGCECACEEVYRQGHCGHSQR